MKRFFILAVALLVTFSVVLAVGAEEDSVAISGTLKGEAEFLPSFTNWYGLDLTLTFSGLKAISQTYFTIAPGVTGTQVFKVEYAWDFLTLGGELDLGLVPPAFQSLSLYAEANLFDIMIGEGDFAPSLTADLGIVMVILPTFSGTTTFDLETQVGPLAASSTTKLNLVPFAFQSQKFKAKINFLNATFGEEDTATFTGTLGTNITAFPSFSANLWVKASVAFGDLTATSKTVFDFVPAGGGTQKFTLTYALEELTVTSRTEFDLVPSGEGTGTQLLILHYVVEKATLISETKLSLIPAIEFTAQTVRVEIRRENLLLYTRATFTPPTGLTALVGFRYGFP